MRKGSVHKQVIPIDFEMVSFWLRLWHATLWHVVTCWKMLWHVVTCYVTLLCCDVDVLAPVIKYATETSLGLQCSSRDFPPSPNARTCSVVVCCIWSLPKIKSSCCCFVRFLCPVEYRSPMIVKEHQRRAKIKPKEGQFLAKIISWWRILGTAVICSPWCSGRPKPIFSSSSKRLMAFTVLMRNSAAKSCWAWILLDLLGFDQKVEQRTMDGRMAAWTSVGHGTTVSKQMNEMNDMAARSMTSIAALHLSIDKFVSDALLNCKRNTSERKWKKKQTTPWCFLVTMPKNAPCFSALVLFAEFHTHQWFIDSSYSGLSYFGPGNRTAQDTTFNIYNLNIFEIFCNSGLNGRQMGWARPCEWRHGKS